MPSEYWRAWLVAFAFTQLIEVPIYRGLLGCTTLRAFGASVLTHPAIWFVLFPLLHESYVVKVAIAELFAWSVEALYFCYPFGMRRAFQVTFSANLTSFGLGLLSRSLIGAP